MCLCGTQKVYRQRAIGKWCCGVVLLKVLSEVPLLQKLKAHLAKQRVAEYHAKLTSYSLTIYTKWRATKYHTKVTSYQVYNMLPYKSIYQVMCPELAIAWYQVPST